MTDRKAVYLDGQTSREREAGIVTDRNGVTIIPADGQKIIWPFTAIKIEKDYDRHSESAVFSHRHFPEARLVVTDRDIYAEIAGNLKQKQAFAVPFTLKALSGLFLICAVMVMAGFYYIRYESRILAPMIPDKIQQAYVDEIAKGFKQAETPCSREQQATTEKLAGKIASTNGMKPPKILIVPDSEINAYAIPGNTILVNRGMLKDLQNESELSGVLAHELGHLKHHHPQQKFINTVGTGIFTSLVLGTGDINTITQIAVAAQDITYSRKMEEQADDEAVIFMKQSGIDPKGITGFFGRMEARDKLKSKVELQLADYLSSHPATPDRIGKFTQSGPYKFRRLLTDDEWKKIRQACVTVKTPAKK